MKKLIEFEFDIKDNEISCIQLITKNGSIYRGEVVSTIENNEYMMRYEGKIYTNNDLDKLMQIETYKNDIDISKYPFIESIYINLNRCYITDSILEKILICWKNPKFKSILNKLKVLKIQDNPINLKGFTMLFKFIEQHCPSICELDTNINIEEYKILKNIISKDIHTTYIMN